jgi:ribosomal subunit interface protein
MKLTWNIVTENMTWPKPLEKKLRQKITKLEQHLKHFPPDAVHLLISMERSRKKPLYTAALTLRVPHNILRAAKGARDPLPAFDNAVKTLLRELELFKAKLRHHEPWKRKARRKRLHEAKAAPFSAAPMARGTGPQNLRDVVAKLLEKEYVPLLHHVQQLIRDRVLLGELPPGAVEARAVVDETARQALAAPADKPDDRSYRVWLYDLARHELQHRLAAWREESREKLPVEPTIETTPDAEVARKDWLEYLQHAAKKWPADERAVFELYFLEGFEPDEVAMLLKRSPREVETLIGAVQTRLRWELAHEEE